MENTSSLWPASPPPYVAIEREHGSITPIWPYRIEKNEVPVVVGFSNPNFIHQGQLRKIVTQTFQLGCDRSVFNVPLVTLKHQDSLIGFRFDKFGEFLLQRGSNG